MYSSVSVKELRRLPRPAVPAFPAGSTPRSPSSRASGSRWSCFSCATARSATASLNRLIQRVSDKVTQGESPGSGGVPERAFVGRQFRAKCLAICTPAQAVHGAQRAGEPVLDGIVIEHGRGSPEAQVRAATRPFDQALRHVVSHRTPSILVRDDPPERPAPP